MAHLHYSKVRRLAASLCVAGAFAAPLLAHAEMDATVRDALAMTEKGQGKQAFDLLAPQEEARAGDPDFDTVLGIAANEAGEFTRAIMALERVLATQPANARARAELGRALFAVGDNRAARTFLQQTKDMGAPPDAAARIDQFLQAIDRVESEGKSNWAAYVEASVGNDSNASSGSGSTTFAVPGFPTPLPTPNMKNAAMFSSIAAGVTGRFVIDPRWSIVTMANANARYNDSGATQYDNTEYTVGAGVSYRVERNEFTLVGQYNDYDAGVSKRSITGMTGEWTYRFDGFRQLNTYAQFSRLRYDPLPIYDTHRSVVGTSYAQAFANGMLAFGGVYLGKEDPVADNVPSVGFHLWGARVGGQMPIRGDLAAFTTLGYEGRRYGGDNYPPFFAYKREDKQYSASIGMAWTPVKTWRVTPLLSWVHNDSNVDPFTYDRTMLSVTVRKQF